MTAGLQSDCRDRDTHPEASVGLGRWLQRLGPEWKGRDHDAWAGGGAEGKEDFAVTPLCLA